ncbi:hypothetical protein [Mycoplasma seminis]|uniref:Uncharacterized protein n=1 Tax=Mycoplasma seminis TaxID=512749 RepID=A0ABY9H9H5_9MOLU|nr:hypothetical protein [Mycoplasma seminis]WLP85237.1 hypothetical protein Q8852_02855 [Mycoplasma seminis]
MWNTGTLGIGVGIVKNNPRVHSTTNQIGELKETVFLDVLTQVPQKLGEPPRQLITKLQVRGNLAQKAKLLKPETLITWIGSPYINESRNEQAQTSYKIMTFDLISFSAKQLDPNNVVDYEAEFGRTYTKVQALVRIIEEPKELERTTLLKTVFNIPNSEKGIFLDMYTGTDRKAFNFFDSEDFKNVQKGSKIYCVFRPYASVAQSMKNMWNYVETKGELLSYFFVEPANIPQDITITPPKQYEATYEVDSNPESISSLKTETVKDITAMFDFSDK